MFFVPLVSLPRQNRMLCKRKPPAILQIEHENKLVSGLFSHGKGAGSFSSVTHTREKNCPKLNCAFSMGLVNTWKSTAGSSFGRME